MITTLKKQEYRSSVSLQAFTNRKKEMKSIETEIGIAKYL